MEHVLDILITVHCLTPYLDRASVPPNIFPGMNVILEVVVNGVQMLASQPSQEGRDREYLTFSGGVVSLSCTCEPGHHQTYVLAC